MEHMILDHGIQMPIEGYGVFQLTEEKQCRQCVSDALELGYRLIDTGASFGNEEFVGDAVQASGVKREELFITSKLWIQDAGYEATKRAFDLSLKKLKLDYLDLYLIQQPFGDYYGSWRAMEELRAEGAVRAIGVSNFPPERLIDLCMNSQTVPAVNQVEIHPFCQQKEALQVMGDMDVAPQAWGPLSEGQKDIFHNKTLTAIGKKHGKSAAQVILRWHIQRGVAVIPKTVHEERMKENLDIWDFELSEREMERIALLDIGHSEIMDNHCWYTARQLNGFRIHA